MEINLVGPRSPPPHAGSPTNGDRYAYTGRERNVEAQLQYNRARWYDPATGRWITQDPLGFDAGDSNLYLYVKNRPLQSADPTGWFGTGGIVGGAFELGIPFFFPFNLRFGIKAEAGAGFFVDPSHLRRVQFGIFFSAGVHVGIFTPLGFGYPGGVGAGYIAGAFWGGGGGVFVAPVARQVEDLKGPAQSFALNFGAGLLPKWSWSLSVGRTTRGLMISATTGWGIGISASTYPVKTWVKGWPLHSIPARAAVVTEFKAKARALVANERQDAVDFLTAELKTQIADAKNNIPAWVLWPFRNFFRNDLDNFAAHQIAMMNGQFNRVSDEAFSKVG